MEKVYVAVGSDIQDGYKAIDWALKKWNSLSLSIVILHFCNISKDFVSTPFGKLPVSSVSEEKLEVLRKYEEEKTDKLLSKYIAFSGKVKTEILKVEKQEQPIQMVIVDLIFKLRITKLVMDITFMRSSSWKSKSAISGSFYVYKHKPEFCEFYIICGGKMVTLKRDNDCSNFMNWIGNMFNDPVRNLDRSLTNGEDLTNSEKNPWDKNMRETEDYFQQLLCLNLDEETDDDDEEEEIDDVLQHMNEEEKIEYVKRKTKEAQKKIEQKQRETKTNVERQVKAEWAISLCNKRIEDLETWIKEETERRIIINETLKTEKEQLDQITRDVEEGKAKLSSFVLVQGDLSSKLRTLTMAKSNAEAQLHKFVLQRGEMIKEIEKLRHQRDIFTRRIDFCKEKDAISVDEDVRCRYREYTAEDVRLATDDFSDRWRLKSGGNWTNVYRGRIKYTTLAVKMVGDCLSEHEFRYKVGVLSEIRHPNLVAIIGFCLEPKCLLFEYMHNGNLRDSLYTSQRKPGRSRILQWHDRIRIAHQVCSGLGFLHSAMPKPIIHGHLTPSKILLDRNLVPKINGFGLIVDNDQSDTKPDIRAFGVLLLHLLTGRNWPGLLKAMTMNQTAVLKDLDEMAGKWPLDLAKDVAELAIKCLSVNREGSMDMGVGMIMEELGKIRQKSDEFRMIKGYEEDLNDVPSVFHCPILQEVMKNPHVAADGFSYEQEAIEEWLKMGHDTSPMTNLKLDHQFLTPNHTLRSLIQDWHRKRAAQASS